MVQVADQYRIRQAYYIEKKSQREIAREFGYSRNTVKKAIEQEEAFKYRRQQVVKAPVLGPYKERLKELVEANRELPRKQRYTARKMYDIIREAGYQGAESTVRYQVAQLRKAPANNVFTSRWNMSQGWICRWTGAKLWSSWAAK
jgi:transposase